MEPRHPRLRVLDFVLVVQPRSPPARGDQIGRFPPTAGADPSTPSEAVGGRRPCRSKNFPNRCRASSVDLSSRLRARARDPAGLPAPRPAPPPASSRPPDNSAPVSTRMTARSSPVPRFDRRKLGATTSHALRSWPIANTARSPSAPPRNTSAAARRGPASSPISAPRPPGSESRRPIAPHPRVPRQRPQSSPHGHPIPQIVLRAHDRLLSHGALRCAVSNSQRNPRAANRSRSFHPDYSAWLGEQQRALAYGAAALESQRSLRPGLRLPPSRGRSKVRRPTAPHAIEPVSPYRRCATNQRDGARPAQTSRSLSPS